MPALFSVISSGAVADKAGLRLGRTQRVHHLISALPWRGSRHESEVRPRRPNGQRDGLRLDRFLIAPWHHAGSPRRRITSPAKPRVGTSHTAAPINLR